MKKVFLTLALTASMLLPGMANAMPVDYSSATGTLDMGIFPGYQYGTISYTSSPQSVDETGYMPANTILTFSYNFTGINSGGLLPGGVIFGDYGYTANSNTYNGNGTWAYGFLPGFNCKSCNGSYINGVITQPQLVTATGSSTDIYNATAGTDTITVNMILKNLSNQNVSFGSFFSTYEFSNAVMSPVQYSIGAVPLPSSLPMWLAAMAGMFGFSCFRRKSGSSA